MQTPSKTAPFPCPVFYAVVVVCQLTAVLVCLLIVTMSYLLDWCVQVVVIYLPLPRSW